MCVVIVVRVSRQGSFSLSSENMCNERSTPYAKHERTEPYHNLPLVATSETKATSILD